MSSCCFSNTGTVDTRLESDFAVALLVFIRVTLCVTYGLYENLAAGPLFNIAHQPVQCRLLVQDNTQEGSVDMKPAIVLNEAQFLEFVHEEIDPAARCPDHFRQRLLRYFGKHFLRLVLLAIPSEQQ